MFSGVSWIFQRVYFGAFWCFLVFSSELLQISGEFLGFLGDFWSFGCFPGDFEIFRIIEFSSCGIIGFVVHPWGHGIYWFLWGFNFNKGFVDNGLSGCLDRLGWRKGVCRVYRSYLVFVRLRGHSGGCCTIAVCRVSEWVFLWHL